MITSIAWPPKESGKGVSQPCQHGTVTSDDSYCIKRLFFLDKLSYCRSAVMLTSSTICEVGLGSLNLL